MTARRHAAVHRLRVAALDPAADDAVALTLGVPDELRDEFRWRAGQHVTINGDDGIRRSFSICTPPSSGVLRVGVRRLPGGHFSGEVLDRLAPGDELEVMTPVGGFTPDVRPEAARHHVCVAAGSGITPLLSIAATLLEEEPRSRVTLVRADRTVGSVMFLDEVADLKDTHLDRFRVLQVLSREPRDVELLSGRLDGARLGALCEALLDPAGVDEWYLCGPQAMVADLTATLEGLGARSVRSELFHADPAPRAVVPDTVPEGAATVTVRLDGRSSTFALEPGGEPVLDAALRVRPELPFACRGGVCGTCRARVVEGTVAMDARWALEDDEVAGGHVLTCQSHPTSPVVVLDYDG